MSQLIDKEGITLYQGDALTTLQILPSASVDAIITDPPYCSGAATLAGKQLTRQISTSKQGQNADTRPCLAMPKTSAASRSGVRSGFPNVGASPKKAHPC